MGIITSKRRRQPHPSLAIPELLILILTFVGEGIEEDPKRWVELYSSLALVCQTWRGPATDLLWSIQSSLLPLLRLLPRDAYDEVRSPIPVSSLEYYGTVNH